MEIKRVADHFIVDLAKKQFHVYWPREWKFGENLIKRVCERLTEQEVYALSEVIEIMNSAIREDRKATEEELSKVMDVDKHIAHLLSLQITVFCQTCPVEYIEKLIEAAHALIWISARKGHKEAFDKRFENMETETERKLMDTNNINDWYVTRALIARHLTNDIMGIYRHALLNNDKKIIKSVLHNPTKDQISLYSLILQVFKESPFHTDLDTKSFDNEDINNIKFKIVELYKYLVDTDDGRVLAGLIDTTADINKVLVDDIVLDDFWKAVIGAIKQAQDIGNIEKLGTLKNLVEALCALYPRKSLIDENAYCTMSNEERRKAILDVFAYWDAHMPDDIAWIKEQQEIDAKIKAERQAKIDADDKAYVGKTQAEMDAEKEKLELTLHDEDGTEVASTPLN